MQTAPGKMPVRRRARAVVVGLAALSALVLAGCVEVPVANPAPVPQREAPPKEELAGLKEVPVAGYQTLGKEAAAFLTEDRNIYCTITTEQGGIIDSPVDPRLAGGKRDDTILAVPAVYCEMVRYPEPTESPDDCSGTNLGFLGGTVLLTSEGATYGGCRIGMTLMEAELAPGSDPEDSPVGRLPVLQQGMAIELNGFRCGSLAGGVACLEAESGQGFAVSADSFEKLTP